MKQPNLSSRLQVIVDQITSGSVVADIGCDHGLLSVCVALQKKPKLVYACDINPQPLAAAKRNIEAYRVEQRVQTVLTDGLEKLTNKAFIDTVVIAGMGGELIAQIIHRTSWVKDKKIKLLLQPMSGHEKLREYLIQAGFTIKKEVPVVERDKIYTVLSVAFGAEKKKYPQWYCYLGEIPGAENREKRDYYNWVLHRLQKTLEGKKKSAKEETMQLEELISEIKKLGDQL